MAHKHSPFNCMKRHKKPPEPKNEPIARNVDVPEPINELVDDSDMHGYARISSLERDNSAAEPASNNIDGYNNSDQEDGEPVEEMVEVTVFKEAQASQPVYTDIKREAMPGTSAASKGPTVPDKSTSVSSKKVDQIPTPRSASSNPVASQRSPRRVGFHGDESARLSTDTMDGAGQSSVSFRDDDRERAAPAAPAGGSANHQGHLLVGVSINSYGLDSTLPNDQSADLSESARSNHQQTSQSQSHDPSDVQSLKRTIRRLTSELSRLLTSRDGAPGEASEARKLLPGKGPVPPWLCDARVFAPLLAAYEAQLNGKDEATQRCEARLQMVEAQADELVRENERLRLKLQEAAMTASTALPSSQSDMDAFTEQARLVLEENQLLIHQLNLQQERAKQSHKNYMTDTTRLKNRTEELEVENDELRSEFERLRARLQEVKGKYQSAVMDREDEDMSTVDRVKTLHRELLEVREQHKEAMEEVTRHLQNSERERTRLAEDLADTAAEKEKLTVEVIGLKHALQNKHRDNILLQKFVKKHNKLQQYLDSVVSAATNLQNERDAFRSAMEAQEQQLAKLANQLIEELKLQNAFNERSKIKAKPSVKLEKLIQTIVDLLKENEGKRDDLEKQVRYQQSLLRQKSQQLESAETDKRNVEDELETVWNTAVAN